jgi:serine protease
MNIRTFTSATVAAVTLSLGALTAVPAGALQRSVHAPSAVAQLRHTGRVLFLTIPAERAARKAALAAERLHAHATSASTLSAHGGTNGVETVIGQPKVYVVFYGSQWGTDTVTGRYDMFSGDTQGLAPRLEALYAGLGTNGEGWSSVLTQYCDGVASGTTTCAPTAVHVPYPSANVLAGVWYDNATASPSNATGNQLALEANAAAAHFGNTTQAQNRNTQYIIVSPTGTHPDGFNTSTGNFCAYHDYNTDPSLTGGAAPSTYGTFAWTNQPYLLDLGASCGTNYVNAGAAGTLDGVSIVAGHEYAESMTDLWPSGGWYSTSTGKENGDLCAWVGVGGTGGAQNVAFSTGSFPMQATWSNATNACAISAQTVTTQPFSVSLSSSSASVTQGASATTTVTTASSAASTIALSATGLPTGASATFSPASVTAGSSSMLTVTTSSTTPAGTYAVVVNGASNGVNQTATFTVTVAAPGSLSLGLSAASASVSAGASTTTVASPTISSGSAVSTTLTASGLPTGVTASFAPATLNTGTTSTVSLATASTTAAGTYTITITATSGALTASKTFALTVTAAAASTYALSLSPTSGTTALGGILQSTLTSAVSSGAGQAVTLSATGQPTGVTVSAASALVTGGSVTVRFQVSTSAKHGTYAITLKGVTGSQSASAVYTITF